jgi:transposase InsO family protein
MLVSNSLSSRDRELNEVGASGRPAARDSDRQAPPRIRFIEAFNGRLRDECLNVHQFTSIDDAKAKIEAWRVDYNQRRPHGSLGHLTPNEYAQQRQNTPTAEAAFF